MKKIILVLMLVLPMIMKAQAPQSFRYQTVVRNNEGNILCSTPVNMRISICSDMDCNQSFYKEEHSGVTSPSGVLSVNIGNGIPLFGQFDTIPWAKNDYFIRLEIDVQNTGNYVYMGSSQLLSVPYALHAAQAETAMDDFDRDTLNELQTIRISNDTIFLSNGGFVKLPDYGIGQGGQMLLSNCNNTFEYLNSMCQTNELEVSSIAIDNEGKIYLIGDIKKWNGQTFEAGTNVLVTDINGTVYWSKKVPNVIDINFDNEGNVYVCGSGIGSYDFGSGVQITISNLCAYLVKYSQEGTPLWCSYGTYTSSSYPPRVQVETTGNNIQLAMFNMGGVHWNGNYINTGTYGITFDNSGNIIQISPVEYSTTSSMEQYASNKTNRLTLIVSSGSIKYLLQYDENWNFLWKQELKIYQINGSLQTPVYKNDKLYVTGNYQPPLSIGSFLLNGNGYNSYCTIAINANSGEILWARENGGIGVAFNSNNQLVASGLFTTTLNVDDVLYQPLAQQSAYNLYLDQTDGSTVEFTQIEGNSQIDRYYVLNNESAAYALFRITGAFYNNGQRFDAGWYIVEL